MAIFSRKTDNSTDRNKINMLMNLTNASAKFRVKQAQLVVELKRGEITGEEFNRGLIEIDNSYEEMRAKSQKDRTEFRPYNTSDIIKMQTDDRVYECVEEIVNVYATAKEATKSRFELLDRFMEEMPEEAKQLEQNNKPFSDTLKKYKNQYYNIILDAAFKDFGYKNLFGENRVRLDDYKTAMNRANQTAENMPQELVRLANGSYSGNSISEKDIGEAKKLMNAIAGVEAFFIKAKESKIEKSYEENDSSDLVMIFEKMNHNPKNIAQIGAIIEQKLSNPYSKIELPEGGYTQEEIDRMFEAPTARKITKKMYDINKKLYDGVYSKIEKYQNKDEIPVELTPYEEAADSLDYIYRQHITRYAGPKTIERCFPSERDRDEFYRFVNIDYGNDKIHFKKTVDKLDDIGERGTSSKISLQNYSTDIDRYVKENETYIAYSRPDERSADIKSMYFLKKIQLAKQVKENRELKKLQRDSEFRAPKIENEQK